jgi:hypothetical protein
MVQKDDELAECLAHAESSARAQISIQGSGAHQDVQHSATGNYAEVSVTPGVRPTESPSSLLLQPVAAFHQVCRHCKAVRRHRPRSSAPTHIIFISHSTSYYSRTHNVHIHVTPRHPTPCVARLRVALESLALSTLHHVGFLARCASQPTDISVAAVEAAGPCVRINPRARTMSLATRCFDATCLSGFPARP